MLPFEEIPFVSWGSPLCNNVQVFLCEISSVCRLKYPYSCFSSQFGFLVFVVFLSVLMLSLLFLAVVISFSLLFYVMLCPCIDVFTQPSMRLSPISSFFSQHYCQCHLLDIRSCASSLTFFFSGPFVWVLVLSILRMVPSIFEGWLLRWLSLWWDYCHRVCFREVFSFFKGILYLFFLSSCLFNAIHF